MAVCGKPSNALARSRVKVLFNPLPTPRMVSRRASTSSKAEARNLSRIACCNFPTLASHGGSPPHA